MAMLKESREHFETLEMNKRSIHSEVDAVRQDINKHLDTLEAKLRRNLDEIHKEAAKECQYRIAELEARQSAIQEYQRRLENVIKFWSQRRDSDLSAIQTFYEKILQHRLDTANKCYEYEFQINEKIDNLKSLIKHFGSVRLHCYANSFDDSGVRDIQSPQFDQSLEDCTASVTNSFSICEDPSSDIGGCTYLYNGLLMIGNRLKNSLQQYDPNGTLTAELPLAGKPWDVCLVNPFTVGVSLPSNKPWNMSYVSTIAIVDTIHMKTVKEITIHSKIYGVAYGEEKFYVACVTEVKILNLKGESVHVIRVPNACIRQVCTDKGRLMFSDWNHNSIQCFGRDGIEVFTFTHPLMKGPVGISVDYENNIYVTSFISNNVHQLTPDGQLNRILLNKDDGIKEPRAICLQKYNNRFVVCDSTGVKLCELLSSST